MTEVRFEDTAPILGTRITADGYLHGDVRCARVGCQDYLGDEMGRPDLGRVTVYRPESTVFDRASLATFAGKPVTIGHPLEPVTAETWKDVAAGDVGDEIARDGEFVKVPFRLMDAGAIRAVSGGTREVSMGYSCGIEWTDGVAPDGTPYQAIQTGPLRINHLAIVPRARGGSQLRIGDAAGDAGRDRAWGATPIHTNDAQEDGMADPIKTRTVLIDGLSVETTDAGAQALAKLQDTVAARDKALTDAETAHKAALATKDEEIGTLKADLKKAQDALPDAAAVSRMVADRVALERTVAAVAAGVKPDGLTDAALRKAAVAAKLGAEMVKDASDAEVAGMFKAVAKDAATADPVVDALRKAPVVTSNDEAKAYAGYLASFNPERKEAN